MRYHARKNLQTQGLLHVHQTVRLQAVKERRAHHGSANGSTTPSPEPDGSSHFFPRKTSMNKTHNGMPAGQLPAVGWQKSSRSNPSGNCVELTRLHGSPDIAVRNSRDPEGPALVYTPEEMAAFIEGARGGDFDHLIA
jgi:hypothetical protein